MRVCFFVSWGMKPVKEKMTHDTCLRQTLFRELLPYIEITKRSFGDRKERLDSTPNTAKKSENL